MNVWHNGLNQIESPPAIFAVVKGKNGLDIYCTHMSTDETANYMLMRQKNSSFVKFDMGGFYQMYE